MGLSGSPLTPRCCRPVHSSLLASAWPSPGSPPPGPHLASVQSVDQMVGDSGLPLGEASDGRSGPTPSVSSSPSHKRSRSLHPSPGPPVRGGPFQVQGEAAQGLVPHPACVRRGDRQAEGPGGGQQDVPGKGFCFLGSPAVGHPICALYASSLVVWWLERAAFTTVAQVPSLVGELSSHIKRLYAAAEN